MTKPFNEGHTRYLEEASVIALLNAKITGCTDRIADWQERRFALMADAENNNPDEAMALTVKIEAEKIRRGAITVARDHLKFCEAFEFQKKDAKGGIFCLPAEGVTLDAA